MKNPICLDFVLALQCLTWRIIWPN